jgi:peptide/nickel transport system ATP-binding protein
MNTSESTRTAPVDRTPSGTRTRTSDEAPILEVIGLTKYFNVGGGFRPKRLRALNDVSFSLRRGEVISLVGESGSGKSTVLKMLSRLEQPTSGKILFKGRDLLAEEPSSASLAYRGQVQMIFQDPFGSLNPIHTVAYHLARPLERHGKARSRDEIERKVLELLSTVGLNPAAEFAAKHPHQMSGGQRQRVAIARALAVDPDVILADEPISMLDVSIRMGVLNLMEELKSSRGIGYLYVTHDIASARYIGDRTMVMYAGHMVEGGASDELLDHPAHPYTKLLLEAVPDPRGNIFRELPAKSGAPQLVDPPPGCPFAARCPEVMAVCREESPRPVPLRRSRDAGEHFVRCHLYADQAGAPANT